MTRSCSTRTHSNKRTHSSKRTHSIKTLRGDSLHKGGGEEEEDLFVFNDTRRWLGWA